MLRSYGPSAKDDEGNDSDAMTMLAMIVVMMRAMTVIMTL